MQAPTLQFAMPSVIGNNFPWISDYDKRTRVHPCHHNITFPINNCHSMVSTTAMTTTTPSTKSVIWCTFIHMAATTSSMTNAAQTLSKQLYLDPKIPRCCYANYIESHNDPSRIRTCVATDIPSPGEQPNTSPFIVPSQWLTILQETVPIVQWMVPPSLLFLDDY